MNTYRQRVFNLLRGFESRNVTFMEPDNSWPIVWARASGVFIWDTEGHKYLDLTSAFGVAATGHANPRVVKAGQRQMRRLLHAMSDVHPHELKAQLARELSRLTYERWSASAKQSVSGKTIFCNSGSEAVEAALKTAALATKKPGVIAFRSAYHGLGYGALNVTHRQHFRLPFLQQMGGFGHFVRFPTQPEELDKVEREIRPLFRRKQIGAVLAEPVQGRGGVNIPPHDFLLRLREICDRHGALLILDEIFTGFGRTGQWFACEHSGVMPDIICIGKSLTGGFPLSACVGRSDVMDTAWPPATGDPIHTSTFLAHPVGCAMALAQVKEIARLGLITRSRKIGKYLIDTLLDLQESAPIPTYARGIGMLAGLELCSADGSPASDLTFRITKKMLKQGYILLPDGDNANVITFTPPLTIHKEQINSTVTALKKIMTQEQDHR